MAKIGVLAATVCCAALAYAEPARRLHAPPGVIGEIARESGARQLVLSHLMARSLRDLDQNLAAVRSSYVGPIVVANDLHCILLTP
jgi:ribonuclease BN (tRNA processing enzyme)